MYDIYLNTSSSQWYTVYCKPRKEAVAEQNLQRQDYQVYLPRIRMPHRRRSRWVEVIEPLFPRYLFIQLDINRDNTAPIRSTIGVTGLVRFAECPAIVPPEVIDALIANQDPESGLFLHDRPLFCQGDTVRFLDGPFAGLQGIFNKENGDERVIVLLEFLGKLNTVKVPKQWVGKL